MLSAERRNYERRPCSMPVDIDDYENAYVGRIKNLSRGGAFVAAALETPEIGREVFLTIPYDRDKKYLIIHGQVAWIRKDGVGVSFQLPSDTVCGWMGRDGRAVATGEIC